MQEIHLLNTNQLFTTEPNTTIGRRLRQSHLQNQALKCPRCDSLNTKFCYYNNYNLSQPRHFCKNCRRYWTKGGVLRNVPVGGGCRKSSSKRPSASAVKETKFSDEAVRSSSKPKSNSSNSSSETTSSISGSGGIVAAEITPSAATPPSTDSVFKNYVFPQLRNINFSPDLMIAAVRDGDTDTGRLSNVNDTETTAYDYNAKAYDAVSTYQHHEFDRTYEQWQLNTDQGAGGGYLDLTAQIDQVANIESEPLNWHQGNNNTCMD